MGGKKKLGLKQMEKQQVKTDEDTKEAKKKEKAGPPKERKTIGIMGPDPKDGKVIAEVKKMNVLTPYAIASRYGIRISAAKDFLEQLEANGAIQLVSGSHSIKIYKPAA
ncbi:MAG: 30S ribosomal protein S25e [Candidatus Bathyarchaeota archaeon]|nr:30S ribosomal protein S25e [Candidatus Bathyarchaeota archaeon]